MSLVKLGTRVLAALVAVVVVVALASACTDDGRPCYPQDYRACACPGAPHGFQQCTSDGQTYGACDCSGAVPGVSDGGGSGGEASAVDGPAPDGPAAEAAALLPFMSPCDTDAQCDTNLCFNFPSKGPHCTRHCTQPTECPPPSGGCNPQGVCKAP